MKINAEYKNGNLVLSNITDSRGWMIVVSPSMTAKLYEILPTQKQPFLHYEYLTVQESLDEAQSWEKDEAVDLEEVGV